MRRAAIAIVCAAAASLAYAYNDAPESEQVFPRWFAPKPTCPVEPRLYPAAVSYEVQVTGHHVAEVHLRNLSPVAWHFDFWFPGWQRPGDNRRVDLPVLGPDGELKVAVPLRHGRPGLSTSPMRVYELRQGGDDGPACSPLADVADPQLPDESWMPARPLVDDGTVRRSNLEARVRSDGARAVVGFRNPSARDLHFLFAVPGLGVAAGSTPRVTVAGGSETEVGVPSTAAKLPLSLLRVVVSDLRVGDDTGTLFAVDRSADAGWFPVASEDAPAALPPGKLLATLSPLDAGRVRVRFRSRLPSAVHFRFLVPGYEDAGRAGESVSLPPGEEAESVVALDRAADARIALARLRVFNVAFPVSH